MKINYDIRNLNKENYLRYIDELSQIENLTFAEAWSKQAYIRDICENEMASYVALVREYSLIAYANYWLVDNIGNINNVAVNLNMRGLGYGKILMKSLIEDCRKKGGKSMTLEVRESNQKAIYLYKKLGFVSCGIRPNYYENNHEGAVIMWLDL